MGGWSIREHGGRRPFLDNVVEQLDDGTVVTAVEERDGWSATRMVDPRCRLCCSPRAKTGGGGAVVYA